MAITKTEAIKQIDQVLLNAGYGNTISTSYTDDYGKVVLTKTFVSLADRVMRLLNDQRLVARGMLIPEEGAENIAADLATLLDE